MTYYDEKKSKLAVSRAVDPGVVVASVVRENHAGPPQPFLEKTAFQ